MFKYAFKIDFFLKPYVCNFISCQEIFKHKHASNVFILSMGGVLSLTSLACCFTSTACTAGCALCPNCKVSVPAFKRCALECTIYTLQYKRTLQSTLSNIKELYSLHSNIKELYSLHSLI